MTDNMIKDLAEAFARQHQFIDSLLVEDTTSSIQSKSWKSQLRDDTVAVASVIHKHAPEYPIGRFYEIAGYEGAHPNHN